MVSSTMTPLVRVGDSGADAAQNHNGCDNTHRYFALERNAGAVQRKVIPFRGSQEWDSYPWESGWTVRPPASPHRRHDKFCLGSRAGRPACRDGLEPGVEAHTLRPVHVMVAEE